MSATGPNPTIQLHHHRLLELNHSAKQVVIGNMRNAPRKLKKKLKKELKEVEYNDFLLTLALFM